MNAPTIESLISGSVKWVFAVAAASVIAAVGVVVGCGAESEGQPAGAESVSEVRPTPTFIVVVFTPTPIPPPTATPTPRPDNLKRVSFPEDLDPYALNPPETQQATLHLWTSYLSDTVIHRDDGPPIHLCEDGRMLSEDQNIRSGMTWRVGWTQDMAWEKHWEIALFIKNRRGREFMATLLNATDDDFLGAVPEWSDFGLFRSDEC